MKRSEIKELSNEKLIAAFYWVAVRAANETNSRTGFTKQTRKQEEWIIDEVITRFELDKEETWREIIK